MDLQYGLQKRLPYLKQPKKQIWKLLWFRVRYNFTKLNFKRKIGHARTVYKIS